MRFEIDPDDESPEARLCRVVNIIDALPADLRVSDDTPLRAILPGDWPTMADLRALATKHFDKSK